MSFQALLRSFQVFKYTDQNFAGWLVTSKRNPTERLAPSPRPCPRIASGRLETKYSFPDFLLKISACEIHDTSMATSHATRYKQSLFFRCFYSSIYFSFTYINSALALRSFCFFILRGHVPYVTEDLTFDTCTQLFYIFDTGFRFELFPLIFYLHHRSVGCSR